MVGHSGGWGVGEGQEEGVMILALNRITNRWVGRSEHGLRGHAVQRESLDKLTAAATPGGNVSVCVRAAAAC